MKNKLQQYCYEKGIMPETMIISNYPGTYVRIEHIFNAGYEARNGQIQKRIDEITSEIKSIKDMSMSSGQKLIRLRGIKKELKSLLISE